MTYHSHPSQA